MAPSSQLTRVRVVAPGGGTGVNSAIYTALDKDARFDMAILGRSRASYDCYPEDWEDGNAAPNLESFAEELLSQNVLDECDCLVVGSRGGQVVLPSFWRARGASVPPVVVLNGGCAMSLPKQIQWPDSAVTCLLIGGQDFFRGDLSPDEYIDHTVSHVPHGNSTTVILYVHEMQHMPQAQLLSLVLRRLIEASTAWHATGLPPLKQLNAVLQALLSGGWSGRLLYTGRHEERWETYSFGPKGIRRVGLADDKRRKCQQSVGGSAARRPSPSSKDAAPEFTVHAELRALWRAGAQAVAAAQRGFKAGEEETDAGVTPERHLDVPTPLRSKERRATSTSEPEAERPPLRSGGLRNSLRSSWGSAFGE